MEASWLTLAAPLSAILIALITTVFNIYDARKRASLEKIRIINQSMEVFFQGTDYVADKYHTTKLILFECTKMNNLCRASKRWELSPPTVDEVRNFISEIETSLEATRILIASEQAALSLEIHDEYNSFTLPKIREMIVKIEDECQPPFQAAIGISGILTSFKKYVASELHSAAFDRAIEA